jgi:predicted transcriptional regulator
VSYLSTLFVLLLIAAATSATAAPKLGEKPKPVTLSGEAGGKVDGSAWTSDMIKDKVWVLFYVDPDHRNENEDLKEALKKEEFPKDKYATIAVINMAASWLPNAAIASSIESNQKEYPDVTYVKDMNKALVKEWALADDAYVVTVLDKSGKLIFNREGDFSKDDTAAIIKLIREHLND